MRFSLGGFRYTIVIRVTVSSRPKPSARMPFLSPPTHG